MRLRWVAGGLPAKALVAVALLSLNSAEAPSVLDLSRPPLPPVIQAEVRPVPVRVVPRQLAALRPGTGHRLDVVVQNTNTRPVVLAGVRVRVSQVISPRASARRPCGPADFRTRPGSFTGITLDPGGSTSLTRAGVAYEQWPRVEMINRPANQDGCQGARLTLEVLVEGRLL